MHHIIGRRILDLSETHKLKPATMKNYIKMLSAKFAKQISEYGITEVNIINGEFYSTSQFDFHQTLEDAFMEYIKENA